jgi:hypothetical protein
VAGVTSRCIRSCRGSSRANADRTARSGHVGCGWLTWRRSTVRSARSALPALPLVGFSEPVGAEYLIHGGDQQRRSTVDIRHDRRPWRCDCGI